MRKFWGICASFQKVHCCVYSEEGFLHKEQLPAKLVTTTYRQSPKVSKIQFKKKKQNKPNKNITTHKIPATGLLAKFRNACISG